MKKTALILVFVSGCILIYAQVPQGFNYQAIARDGSNAITSPINVEISIQSDSSGGTIFWKELHSLVTPNSLGLFTLVIGKGARQTGSIVSAFSDIDWKVLPKFIHTRIEYNGWKDMGSTRLYSVPYAMTANDLTGTLNKLKVTGDINYDLDSALFEVKNKSGQTVFAVYNEGVRVYVDDVTKGKKGGFAIGGFSSKGDPQNYLVVKPDSIRMYIKDNTSKGTKGGFAIGGFGGSKSGMQDYLNITPDSIRMYINENLIAKGGTTKGGFAIGGFDKSKGTLQDYFKISPDSIRMYINDIPGKGGTTKGGFAIGGFGNAKGQNYEYLRVTSDSSRFYLRDSLSTGFAVKNIQNGKFEDLMKLLHRNYFIGYQSGYNTKLSYDDNIFIGSQSGFTNNTGQDNLFLGHHSGYFQAIGNQNLFLGNNSSWMSSSGYNNICIGNYSGGSNGADNIYIGGSMGGFLHSGNMNVSIGSNSGRYITGSRELVIHSDFLDFPSSPIPLIYGKFDLMQLKFNGDVTISGKESFSGSSLQVIGDASKGSILISPNQDDQSASNAELILAEEKGATYRMGIQYNGTSNQLRIYGAYTNIIYGPHLVINRNDGFVGIGTISPLAKLHVNGNALVQGNLGIGTTSPLTKLDIAGGNNWDLVNGDGDLRIGNSSYRLKIGVALGGGGAGAAGIMQYGQTGGYNVLSIGAQGSYQLFVNGSTQTVGIGTDNPGYKLTVNGTAWCSSGAWTGSDLRWKKNITVFDNALPGILRLQAVNYDLRLDEFPEMGFESGSQIGLIAQDVEKIFPLLVNTDNKGYKAVAYDKLSVILVEGIKEQQKQIAGQQQQIESTKQENMSLKLQLQTLQDKIEQIELMLSKNGIK
jgi:hypothetical protein